MTSIPSITVTDHVIQLYTAYRHTTDNDAKGLFFAVDCRQICRPIPSYAAQDRVTIVRYLHESSGLSIDGSAVKEEKAKKSFATIRPLRPDEYEFGMDEQVKPAGFATADDLKKYALEQGWIGMRVDLWDEEEGELTADGQPQGTLIKVQYWYGKEQKEDGTADWIQVLHDIMYIGQLDGTQGKEGELIE
ncbi:hypothetical protein Sste5346_009946 [Sporothrix stenoceras]|uniref:SnoaL-like domain-containing protein n=1 Tax=Sporothrix stenoceras TaxID=5173 RepID=A0ABR3YI65_9PEZI